MTRRRIAGALVAAAILAILAWSLLAIGITGPVVVRTRRLQLDVDVSSSRLRDDVERLAGELSPRSHRNRENLGRVAEWIASEFRGASLVVQLQDYELPEGRFRNVIGYREGLEPEAPVRIVGAHYDAYGDGPGADDNASGVAVLLELVRTLHAERPRRSQYFVAFGTEEPPFFGGEGMGSHVFASALAEQGVRVDLMVALDLVGYYSDEPGSQEFPLPGLGLLYPDRGNFVAVVGDAGSGATIKRVKQYLRSMTDLSVHSFRAPRAVAGVDWSDHSSFRRVGYPGVLVTDTAFLRNPHYHTPEDTPETLDYERMAEVVRGLHGLVWDRDISD